MLANSPAAAGRGAAGRPPAAPCAGVGCVVVATRGRPGVLRPGAFDRSTGTPSEFEPTELFRTTGSEFAGFAGSHTDGIGTRLTGLRRPGPAHWPFNGCARTSRSARRGGRFRHRPTRQRPAVS